MALSSLVKYAGWRTIVGHVPNVAALIVTVGLIFWALMWLFVKRYDVFSIFQLCMSTGGQTTGIGQNADWSSVQCR